MYASILPVLRCPHCGSGFELTESKKDGGEIVTGKIVCEKGHSFSIREGILDFQSQEQELLNSWSEYSKAESDDSLDRKFDAGKTENQRKIELFQSGITASTWPVPMEGDLIPCAGEWFANTVLIAE